jgi:hypothetical protein
MLKPRLFMTYLLISNLYSVLPELSKKHLIFPLLLCPEVLGLNGSSCRDGSTPPRHVSIHLSVDDTVHIAGV